MERNNNVLQGVECPKCSSQGPFKLVVTVRGTATVSDDGWDDLCSEESDFDGEAPARCLECSHEAPFETFMEDEDAEDDNSYGDGGEGRMMAGMAHGSRGLADYSGLETDRPSGTGCYGCGGRGCESCNWGEE
jgi:hypothetical protein